MTKWLCICALLYVCVLVVCVQCIRERVIKHFIFYNHNNRIHLKLFACVLCVSVRVYHIYNIMTRAVVIRNDFVHQYFAVYMMCTCAARHTIPHTLLDRFSYLANRELLNLIFTQNYLAIHLVLYDVRCAAQWKHCCHAWILTLKSKLFEHYSVRLDRMTESTQL